MNFWVHIILVLFHIKNQWYPIALKINTFLNIYYIYIKTNVNELTSISMLNMFI